MRWFKCRQCGTQAHDGKTCAERLHELLFASHPGLRSECLEAAARFALQHPATYSGESLELARRQLDAGPCSTAINPGVSAELAGGENTESSSGPSGASRPLWHVLARRLGCRLSGCRVSRRILRRLH